MQAKTVNLDFREVSVLLRGQPDLLRSWTEAWQAGRLTVCLAVLVSGSGLYGAAMGLWRSPLQGFFVALKLPLIVLLTTLGNALLNAMLAPLLGVSLSLKQSLRVILMSFTIASATLGAFSPLAAFLVWNSPPMTADLHISSGTYSLIQLAHVVMIAFAGIIGNLRLSQLLRELSGNAAAARRVMLAWLAGNLFLGTQLSWILRPFIGSPSLPVEFLRADAFHGNFFESVLRSIWRVLDLN